jgi:hypothetical protein
MISSTPRVAGQYTENKNVVYIHHKPAYKEVEQYTPVVT